MSETNDYFVKKILRKYLVPTVLTLLGTTVASFANNILAGRMLGRDALTSMNIVSSFSFLFAMLGCLISNLITGCVLPDIIFGTLATLIGAVGTYALRSNRYLCALPPIISNALIIPFILSYAYHIPGGIPFFMLTVGAGEFLSCMVLGQLLISALLKVRGRIFAED